MLSFLRRLLVGSLFLFCFVSGQAQVLNQYGWAFEIPNESNQQAVGGPDGALYIGRTVEDFVFRGVNYRSTTGVDAVVIKVLPTGALDWVVRLGHPGRDRLESLAIDDRGRLVVVGYERDGSVSAIKRQWTVNTAGQVVDVLDEDPFVPFWSLPRVSLAQGNGFVENSGGGFKRLNAQGRIVWGRGLSRLQSASAVAVRGLADGTFLAIGSTSGTTGSLRRFGDAIPAEEEYEDVNGPFIARFAEDGELLWAKSAEEPVSVRSSQFTDSIDESGNAVFGGSFEGTLQLDGRRLVSATGEGSLVRNGVLVRWDSNGSLKWIKHFASPSGSHIRTLGRLADGTVVVTGWFRDQLSLDGQTLLAESFDGASEFLVGVRPDGTSFDLHGLLIRDQAILPTSSGALYLYGGFDGRREFGNWFVGTEGGRRISFMARLGNLPPTIAEHPESLTLTDVSLPSFDVLVTGTDPFELQWRKDGLPLEESDRFTGVTELTLRARQVGRDNAGAYDVVVTSGSTSVTSRPAIVSFENAPPVFTQAVWRQLEFNQVNEEIVYRAPLAVEDPDGDSSFAWSLANLSGSRGEPIEVSLVSTMGASNELIVRWPPPNGQQIGQRDYAGRVTVSDPSGAAVELPVSVSFSPPNPTRLVSTQRIRVEEDAVETFTDHRVVDNDLHPRFINPETLEFRVRVEPEGLGVASVVAAERLTTERDIRIGFTPTPDVYGAGEVVLEVIGSLTPEPVLFSVPVTVDPVNDAPRLLSSVSLLGDAVVGSVVRSDTGQWFDSETDALALKYELQWVVNDRPAVEGARELPGATTDSLLIPSGLLDEYIALRVTVSDIRLEGHLGQVETTVAYSGFLQVGRETTPVPNFSQLPEIAISGGYQMRARPDAFGNDWIRDDDRMINLRDPEFSFDINDRVTPPLRSNDSRSDWLAFFVFENNPDWIGMRGSSIETWVFDVETVLNAVQPLSSSDALFSYFVGQGSDRFSSDHLGVVATPESGFFRLSKSNTPGLDELYVDTRDRKRVATLSDVGLARIGAARRWFRLNQDLSHILFLQRTGELVLRRFPSFEFVSEFELGTDLVNGGQSAEWGLTDDVSRALLQAEGVEGQKRMLLVDIESGVVLREFRLEAAQDFIVSLRSGEPGQYLVGGPFTTEINGEAAFVIQRNTDSDRAALLDFVSWSSGEILRTDWIEKGAFYAGDFYHPERPGHILYASALSPSLLVYDIASGSILERLSVPEPLLRDPDDTFTDVRTSRDGRLIFLSNQQGHTAAFHPLASGEVRGVVFEDRNRNGRLDFGVIQSDSPHLVYVIDVSGSVEDPFVGTAVGDVNFDGRANTILDAELAAFTSLHRNLMRFGLADDARVAVVGFSDGARAFGLNGFVGAGQAMMAGTEDTDGNLVPDVLQALTRVRVSAGGIGRGTDFLTGLSLARDIFEAAGTAPEQANIVFLSDGEASNNFQELAAELRGLGVNIRAIGVGRDSSLNALRRMDPGAIQVASSDELIAALEPEEELLEGVPVFADLDSSGSRGENEPATTTLTDNAFSSLVESGAYGLRPLPSGTYPVGVDFPGFEYTSDPVVQVNPVVPVIHLIGLRSIHQVDPPSIAIQPLGGEWELGQTVRLSVFVVGTGLRFQWFKNGSAIVGETDSALILENVQLEDAGDYTVRIVNDGGTADSIRATVSVRVPPRVISLGEAMDAPQFVWRTGGAAEWQSTEAESVVNGSSASVTGVGDGQEAWLETEVMGPGTVEFHWKVSSERGADFLRFELSAEDRTSIFFITGNRDWSPTGKFELAAGVNTLRWIYRKDDANAVGQDAAWVDELVVEASVGVPPTIEYLPAQFVDLGERVLLSPRYSGTRPVTFQWQRNGEDLPNQTFSQLVIPTATLSDAGEYRFVVSNPFGTVSSNPLRLVVRDPAVNPAIVPVTDDVWDVSQGIVITEHSEVESDSDIRDVFGGTFGNRAAAELRGSVDFKRKLQGEQQLIYWRTPEPVTVGRVRLFADGRDGDDVTGREFISMTIRAKTVGSEVFDVTLDQFIPSHPYEFLDEGLILDRKLNRPVTAQEFLVWFGHGSRGTRIMELDAFSPVSFLVQPQSAQVDAGAEVRFFVDVAGSGPFTYQWYRNNVALTVETEAELTLPSVGEDSAGPYRVEVSNVVGPVSSEVANLTVVPSTDPVSILVHPRGFEVAVGDSLVLFAVANGGEPISYQWRKNGLEIPGATRDQLLLSEVGMDDAGRYDVVVANPRGQVVSESTSVSVVGGPPEPGEIPGGTFLDLATMGIVFNENRENQGTFNPLRSGGVAVDGEWAFIGDSIGGTRVCANCGAGRGQVLVFRRTGNDWIQTQVLEEPFDATRSELAFQNFGDRIELAQGTLVVTTGGGDFYSYRLDGDRWVLGQSFVGNFGRATGIAMNAGGSQLIVAPASASYISNQGASVSGYMRHFRRMGLGDVWNPNGFVVNQSLEAPDPAFAAFGLGHIGNDDLEFAPSGRYLAGSTKPAVGLFSATDSGDWRFVERLVSPDPGEGAGAGFGFGHNLALNDAFLVIGDPNRNQFVRGQRRGAVFVYRIDSGSVEHVQTLQQPDLPELSALSSVGPFGNTLAMNDRFLVVGNWAAVADTIPSFNKGLIFLYELVGNRWEFREGLTASQMLPVMAPRFLDEADEPGDLFLENLSTQVDIHGNTLMVSGKLWLGPQRARRMGFIFSLPGGISVPPLPPSGVLGPTLSWDRSVGGLVLEGQIGETYIIEATTDPGDALWVPVATLTLETNRGVWVDPVSNFLPARFYRARFVP